MEERSCQSRRRLRPRRRDLSRRAILEVRDMHWLWIAIQRESPASSGSTISSRARRSSAPTDRVVDDDRIYSAKSIADIDAAFRAEGDTAFGFCGWVVPPDLPLARDPSGVDQSSGQDGCGGQEQLHRGAALRGPLAGWWPRIRMLNWRWSGWVQAPLAASKLADL